MSETASPLPRSNLIDVANMLLNPFMLNDWVADEHGTLFDQRIEIYFGGEDGLEKLHKHIAGNFAALEYFRSVGAIDFVAIRNKNGKPFPWNVHITAVDRKRFFALLENESLQLVGDKVVEQLPINLSPLPPVKQRVGSDFTIHTNGAISYKGEIIKLESGQARVAEAIMTASVNGKWLSTEAISERTGSVRVSKIISEVRGVLQAITKKPKHDFFPNDRTLGYTFRAK